MNKSGPKFDITGDEDYIRKFVEGNQTVDEEDDEDYSETDSSLRFVR